MMQSTLRNTTSRLPREVTICDTAEKNTSWLSNWGHTHSHDKKPFALLIISAEIDLHHIWDKAGTFVFWRPVFFLRPWKRANGGKKKAVLLSTLTDISWLTTGIRVLSSLRIEWKNWLYYNQMAGRHCRGETAPARGCGVVCGKTLRVTNFLCLKFNLSFLINIRPKFLIHIHLPSSVVT
jgi:hypothetical protein